MVNMNQHVTITGIAQKKKNQKSNLIQLVNVHVTAVGLVKDVKFATLLVTAVVLVIHIQTLLMGWYCTK